MTTTDIRRQELLNRLLTGRAPAEQPAIPTIPRDRALPLSSPQRQLWFLDRLRPGATEYVMPFAWRLRGRLDHAALERSLTEVTARHEILRLRAGQVHPGKVHRAGRHDHLYGLARVRGVAGTQDLVAGGHLRQ